VQLDQTRVAIRERDLLEIMDLSLRVLRSAGPGLIASLVIGIAPFFLLNTWLLSGLVPSYIEEPPLEYLLLLTLLVAWEMPLATAPATLYLGRVMFTDRPSLRQLAGDLWRSLPQLLLFQVFGRALLLPWGFTWFLLFAGWPYLNEVILLERNPLQARHRGQLSSWQRAYRLHMGFVGDLFARWLGSLAFGGVLLCAIWGALDGLGAVLFYETEFSPADFTVFLPLAAWLVVGYFAVVRFLCYLDLRIRREGWEVELLLRAEGARAGRRLA